MKTFKILLLALALVMVAGMSVPLAAQEISIYQYRQVAQADMEEFLHRETTYWSKVAENAIKKGNLTFWAVLVKVGGYDIPNGSNVLFINTYKDLDNMAGTWDPSAAFPDVSVESMETISMSKVMHTLFVRSENWVEKAGAVPSNDFNYVSMLYHDTNSPGQLIELENKHWAPFIKASMDGGKTTQKAWGNAVIITPRAQNMKARTISFDLYASLQETLDPTWAEGVEFPNEGLAEINGLEESPRVNYVYRIVKVVDTNVAN